MERLNVADEITKLYESQDRLVDSMIRLTTLVKSILDRVDNLEKRYDSSKSGTAQCGYKEDYRDC